MNRGRPSYLLDDTGDATNVLHGASGGHNPKYKVDIRARHGARDHSVERGQVLRVDEIPNHLYRDLGRGIELEDAERSPRTRLCSSATKSVMKLPVLLSRWASVR